MVVGGMFEELVLKVSHRSQRSRLRRHLRIRLALRGFVLLPGHKSIRLDLGMVGILEETCSQLEARGHLPLLKPWRHGRPRWLKLFVLVGLATAGSRDSRT